MKAEDGAEGDLMDKGWQHNYDLGKKAFEEQKYDAAQGYLEKVSKENNFADVYNMLGLIYYYHSRMNEAIAAFEKAIEINPNYTEASLNLSVVFNELGQFEKSSEIYSKARDSRKGDARSYLDPYVKGKLANMHAAIGTIYKDLGSYVEAAYEFKRALQLSPGFVDIKTDLGVIYRDMKHFALSVRELEDAVRLNPGYVDARIQLGLTYYTMGQHEKAKAEWLKILRTNPQDKMAHMYMNLLLTPSR